MKIDYMTTPPQREFLELDTRWKAFIGGIRSGKTHAGCFQTLIYATEDKRAGCNGLVGGATYKMLQDAIIPKVLEIFPKSIIKDFNKTQKIMELKNGTKLFFRPFESRRQIDRIRGTEFNFAWIDEGAYLPEYAFEVVQGRLTQGEDTRGYVTTSPKGFNWIYDYFVNPERNTQYEAVTGVSSDDNPTLPPEWIDDLKNTYSEDYLRQEFYGQFIKFEGLIYPEFSEDTHLVSDLKHFDIEDYIYGYDAGYRNPRVFLEIARTTEDKYIVTREWYRKEWLLSSAIETFKSEYRGGTIFADPSAKSDIEEMKDRGLKTKAGNNEVEGGIQRLKSLFEKRDLLVYEGCTNLINELHTYRWDEDKDQPIKEVDHALDSLRYALYTDDRQGGGIVVDF